VPELPRDARQRERLREHVAGVHGAARFHCYRCDSGFDRRAHLVRHRDTEGACDKILRKQKSGIQCPFCEARFLTKLALRRHNARRLRYGRCPTRKNVGAMCGWR